MMEFCEAEINLCQLILQLEITPKRIFKSITRMIHKQTPAWNKKSGPVIMDSLNNGIVREWKQFGH